LFFSFARFLIPKTKSVVGIVHDLQGIYAQGKGILGKLLNSIILFFENMAFNRCNTLVFLSKAMKDSALNNYSTNEGKAVVCYPFITISPSEETTDQLNHIFIEGVSHVVYSGGLGEKQNPLGLLSAFTAASKNVEDTHFHIFSAGPLFEKIKSQNTSDKIFFHSLVPEECITELYKKSSLQIIPQLPNTADGSLPSKLPNLLASGCPIAAICDPGTELDVLLSDMPASQPLLSWDNDYLCAQIYDMLQKTTSMSREYIREERGKHAAFHQFYIDYLVEVVSSNKSKA
jgi:colanic acid biosynthesis glycosyl transferase WcaI